MANGHNSGRNSAFGDKSPKIRLSGIGKVIVVASGKGGVGKSTIAVLIAEHLASSGYNVGMADADIHGPSIPHFFNISNQPEIDNKRMVPIDARGIKINSIGLLIDPESAISWRGPMSSKALYQILSGTAWGPLDYLVIDTPPGTGDIHLSLLTNYHVDGVVMVTTPQEIAKTDVQKAIDLYSKLEVPLIGIVENMSYLEDPISGNKQKIFAGNSGQILADKYSTQLICQVPIMPKISEEADSGKAIGHLFNFPIDKIIGF